MDEEFLMPSSYAGYHLEYTDVDLKALKYWRVNWTIAEELRTSMT